MIAAILALALSAPAEPVSVQAEPIKLFDGKTLNGWHMDVPALDKDKDLPKPFIVRNGNLVSLGVPGGHLITNKSYSNYQLIAEYRFVDRPGNCGILVHVSTPRFLYGMFPKSLEVQLQSGDAGDFWCIGEDITVPDMEKRRGPKENWGVDGDKARRIQNLTDDSEKLVGMWNRIVIECKGSNVKVWVNNHLVNEGTNCTATQGKIAIQAEGVEVEFRRLELIPLKKSVGRGDWNRGDGPLN